MTSSLLVAGPQLSLVCHLKVIRLLLRDTASEAYEIIDEAEQHESWGGGSARYTRSHGSLLNYNNVVTSSAGEDRIKKTIRSPFCRTNARLVVVEYSSSIHLNTECRPRIHGDWRVNLLRTTGAAEGHRCTKHGRICKVCVRFQLEVFS